MGLQVGGLDVWPDLLAVGGSADDTRSVLAALLLALLAAKLGDELFRRLRQPVFAGEILAGVVIGPAALGIVEPGPALRIFADLGVMFLLFWIGLATRPDELRAVGRVAVQTGVLSAAVPFLAGWGLGVAFGRSVSDSLFIGAVLAATSVGIAATLLQETHITETRVGRTVLGAAVVTDIIALLLLALTVGISGGETTPLEIVGTFLAAIAFVVFTAVGGVRAVRRVPGALERPHFATDPFADRSSLIPAVLLCLTLAWLGTVIGLAAVVGAFIAGMLVGESDRRHAREPGRIHREVAPLYALFPPFFLVFVGLRLDLDELTRSSSIVLLVALTVVAVASKFAAAVLGSRALGRHDAFVVGAAMLPRAEVATVIASLALAYGAIGERMFSVMVAMTVIIALLVPVPFRRLVAQRSA